jgi:hypothetical protein
MKQMPTGAFSSVPMTISFSRSERTFQPSACVQKRASPGRSRAGPDQTDYEHRWQWLADNSLIDDDAASRFLVGHPDPP